MICKYCNSKMILDDQDFSFEGCTDKYWVCPTCNSTAFEKIRYSKTVGKEFTPSEKLTHEVIKVDDLMYKGCEPHWKCIHCSEHIPFHCYTKQQLEEMYCQRRNKYGK